jgi:hypothetical protein
MPAVSRDVALLYADSAKDYVSTSESDSSRLAVGLQTTAPQPGSYPQVPKLHAQLLQNQLFAFRFEGCHVG